MAAVAGAKFVVRPQTSAEDNLQLAIEIEDVGAMVVSTCAITPTRIHNRSLMRRAMQAIASAVGLDRGANEKQQATVRADPVAQRERVLVLADTEAVARQFGRIMGRSHGLEASIHPAATLTRAVNIEKIIEAVRAGQVTTCMLLSAHPDDIRADVQAGWRDLTARVGASARCEIRSLDAAGHPRRFDPPWASGAMKIDDLLSEETHDPPDHDPEDPTPGG